MKKKWLCILCLLAALCLLPLSVAGAVSQVVRITHYNKVNVRTGPGKSYSYICEVAKGETYEYLGQSGGWYHIQLNSSRDGYIWAEYGAVETATESTSSATGSSGGSSGGSSSGGSSASDGLAELIGLIGGGGSGSSSSGSSSHGADDDAMVVRITHFNKVNVRGGPGTGYSYLCEVANGETFEYLGQSGNWYHILLRDGRDGYIWAEYAVVEQGEAPQPEATGGATQDVSGSGVVRITHFNKVNVRGGPGTGYSYLCEVANGETFEYLGQSGNWYHILLDDGRDGYIWAEYAVVE